MGVIIDSDNFFVDKVLDITIVFVLALVIMFFFITMRSQINVFVMAYIIYMTILIVYYLIYINMNSNKKRDVNYTILNFISIFTLFMNVFSLAIIGNGYIRSGDRYIK